jgi:hypothetical protein
MTGKQLIIAGVLLVAIAAGVGTHWAASMFIIGVAGIVFGLIEVGSERGW